MDGQIQPGANYLEEKAERPRLAPALYQRGKKFGKAEEHAVRLGIHLGVSLVFFLGLRILLFQFNTCANSIQDSRRRGEVGRAESGGTGVEKAEERTVCLGILLRFVVLLTGREMYPVRPGAPPIIEDRRRGRKGKGQRSAWCQHAGFENYIEDEYNFKTRQGGKGGGAHGAPRDPLGVSIGLNTRCAPFDSGLCRTYCRGLLNFTHEERNEEEKAEQRVVRLEIQSPMLLALTSEIPRSIRGSAVPASKQFFSCPSHHWERDSGPRSNKMLIQRPEIEGRPGRSKVFTNWNDNNLNLRETLVPIQVLSQSK
ncbi:hypothetical protein C8R45DRAFT_944138 [Mycena sanguinolenta]|nr:hypothetical protein C8R45DRAFT_944138 [Mycena sanguinolenta]